MTQGTVTTCQSVECPSPATHYSVRMDAAYCHPCACWAQGVSPDQARRLRHLAPPRLLDRPQMSRVMVLA